MAFTTAAAIIGSAALGAVGANASAKAAKKSAAAVTQAADEATALQREIYYDQRGLMAPAISAGASAQAKRMLMTGSTPAEVKAYLASMGAALNATGDVSGSSVAETFGGGLFNSEGEAVSGSGSGQTIDLSPEDYSWVDDWDAGEWLHSTPGYNFNFDEGQRAVERSAAARGDLFSGATGRELVRYGQNYADNEWDDLWGELGELAGDGANATGTTVNVAGQYGDNAAANTVAAGNARASGYTNAGNAWSGFWQGAAGLPMYAYGQGWLGGGKK